VVEFEANFSGMILRGPSLRWPPTKSFMETGAEVGIGKKS
jgi:hypothetical protein